MYKTYDVQNTESNFLTRFDQVSYMICRRIYEKNKMTLGGRGGKSLCGRNVDKSAPHFLIFVSKHLFLSALRS
jgi:hypothetical protein